MSDVSRQWIDRTLAHVLNTPYQQLKDGDQRGINKDAFEKSLFGRAQSFAETDRAKDGRVDLKELTDMVLRQPGLFREVMSEALFKQASTVGPQEFAASPLNPDAVSADPEVAAVLPPPVSRIPGFVPEPDQAAARQAAARFALSHLPPRFQDYDLNRDGSLPRQEFELASQRMRFRTMPSSQQKDEMRRAFIPPGEPYVHHEIEWIYDQVGGSDDQLDKSEFDQSFLGKGAANGFPRFAEVDQDGNGSIDAHEFHDLLGWMTR